MGHRNLIFEEEIIKTANIGDIFEGGMVFYTWSGGTHGYIICENDLPNSIWGCSGTSISTSEDVGTGQSNTNNIIAGCSTIGIAAELCDSLSISGYTDWYLPSYNEQSLIHDAVHLGFGNYTNGVPVSYYIYWSSSQQTDPDTSAQGFNLTTGGAYYKNKNETWYVRAIRSF